MLFVRIISLGSFDVVFYKWDLEVFNNEKLL